MRIGRFSAGGGPARFGIFEDGTVFETADQKTKGARHNLADVMLLAPVERPSKIICVGINYVPHMVESGFDRPAEPVIFSKLPSVLSGPHDPIVLPKAAPGRVDYEAELVVVIGRRGR